MTAQPDIEDDVAARRRMACIPETLHPRRIAAHHMIEGGRELMPDKVVLLRKHCSFAFSGALLRSAGNFVEHRLRAGRQLPFQLPTYVSGDDVSGARDGGGWRLRAV